MSSDIVGAIRKGWWECAEQLASRAAAAGVAGIENEVALESRNLNKRMTSLKRSV